MTASWDCFLFLELLLQSIVTGILIGGLIFELVQVINFAQPDWDVRRVLHRGAFRFEIVK